MLDPYRSSTHLRVALNSSGIHYDPLECTAATLSVYRATGFEEEQLKLFAIGDRLYSEPITIMQELYEHNWLAEKLLALIRTFRRART